MFLAHLRNENNLEGQRISAKALLNLSISSSIYLFKKINILFISI